MKNTTQQDPGEFSRVSLKDAKRRPYHATSSHLNRVERVVPRLGTGVTMDQWKLLKQFAANLEDR